MASEEEPRAAEAQHPVPHQRDHPGRDVHSPEPLPPGQPHDPGGLIEVARLGDQRVIERERHVPRHRGEDREDRRALQAELRAGEQVDERGHRHRQEPQHRDRLQDVEQRDQHLLGPPEPGRRRRVDEGEDEREGQRDEHPQQRPDRVVRQVGRISGDRRRRGVRQERRVQRGGELEQAEQQREERRADNDVRPPQPRPPPQPARGEPARNHHASLPPAARATLYCRDSSFPGGGQASGR